jgi:hypothetical protein
LPGRPARTLGALALAIAFLLPAAVPAAAREPHRPLPNYHPDFITQREGGASTADCLWASASMLVEKWTAGRITVSKDRLRAMSGDTKKGSNFEDLAPVLRKLGLSGKWSPEGGDYVTWGGLRDRIRKGGGAILLGDYHELPRWYGRWAPNFWKKKGKKDNHAIYLDRYDGRTDQYWVMDPLAPAGWKGEWIPARYLRAFAWGTGGGGLWAMVTPTAKRAPFSGVKLGAPEASVRDGRLKIEWDVRKAPKRWKLPRVKVLTRVERVKNPVALGITDAVSAPLGQPAAKKGKPSARYSKKTKTITASRKLPATPGAYEIALSLGERRFGRTVAKSSTIVYVPGERRGSIMVKKPGAAVAGEAFELDATIMNTGSRDWSDPEWLTTSAAEAMDERRDTSIRAHWSLLDATDGDHGASAPGSANIFAVPLKAGDVSQATLTLEAPKTPGRWLLTLDIVDDIVGSFAASGSAPRTLVVTVVDGRERANPRG